MTLHTTRARHRFFGRLRRVCFIYPFPSGILQLACPQDIRYPTDLNLLNDAREKSEGLIDFLYAGCGLLKKSRTYREQARRLYLKTAQKKIKSKKEIRKAIRKQLGFLRRNIKGIHYLLDHYEVIPYDAHQRKYFLVMQTFCTISKPTCMKIKYTV